MKKAEKVKSVQSVITHSNTTLLLIAIVLFGLCSLIFIFFTSMQVMVRSLTNTANGTAQRVEGTISAYENLCGSFSTMPTLSLPDEVFPLEQKINLLTDRAKQFGLLRVGLLDNNGISSLDGKSRAERRYFQEAMKGNITINDPVVTISDKQVAIIVGGPIWKDGIINSEVNSVVFCSIYPETFNEIVMTMGPSKHSKGRIIGEDGVTIASTERNKVLSQYSNINASIRDPQNSTYRKLAKIEKAALSHDQKLFFYSDGLSIKGVVAQPIQNTNNWILLIEAPINDFLQSFYLAFLVFTISGIIVIETCRAMMKKYARQVSIPVTNMAERLRKAAVGDFTSEVESEDSLEEVIIISNATQKLVNRMAMVLNETSDSSEKKNAFNFFNLVNCQDFCTVLENSLNVSISIVDTEGTLLIGTIPKDLSGAVEEKIYAGKKLFGKYYVIPRTNCVLDYSQTKAFAKTMVDIISKVFELFISREESFQAFKKNEIINMNDILSGTESISERIAELIEESKDNLPAATKKQLRALVSKINESTELARLTDMNSHIQETDYNLRELSQKFDTKNILIVEPFVEKLFGDEENIRRSVNCILKYLVCENENADVNVLISCEKLSIATNLKIRISDKAPAFTENQIERLKMLAGKLSLNGEILTTVEQKFLSAFKQIYKMNGTISVECFGSGILNISISIPQLEAN